MNAFTSTPGPKVSKGRPGQTDQGEPSPSGRRTFGLRSGTNAAVFFTGALCLFIGFYATRLVVCWWFCARPGAEAPS